jgi:hypothetical protein
MLRPSPPRDALALSALDVLDDAEVEALFHALTPITLAVVAGGDIPTTRRSACAATTSTTTAHT